MSQANGFMSLSSMSGTNRIYLLAVLRFSDKTVVASYQQGRDVTVEGVRECVAGNGNIETGKRYSSQGDSQTIHYTIDNQGRVYSIVTCPSYSVRSAFCAIEEIAEQFSRDLGDRIASATEQSLTQVSAPILKQIYQKYESPTATAKIDTIHAKIDVVKSTMKDNIQQLLINEDKLERIESATIQLGVQSMAFKNSSKNLVDVMWWKVWKIRLIIIAVIVIVLVIIIVPIAIESQQK